MKSTILTKRIVLPVFKGSLTIVVANNMATAIDWLEDRITESLGYSEKEKASIKALSYSFQEESGKARFFLLFKYTATPGVIAHEVKHLVNRAFAWFDFKLSTANDEMECYYLGDLVDKAWNVVKTYKKQHKK